MAGKKGFWSRLVTPGSEPALSDEDRNRWLEPGGREPAGGWDAPGSPGEVDVPDGVDIVDVARGGPLDAAGIRQGDVITAVDGRPTPSERSLADALGRLRPGESARVSISRGGAELTVTVSAPR